jgi:hypothetical protein
VSTAVTPCRGCGAENTPGRDFCEGCGEYLSWSPAAAAAAVPVADETVTADLPAPAVAAGGDEGLPPTSVLAPGDPAAGERLPPTLVVAPADPVAGRGLPPTLVVAPADPVAGRGLRSPAPAVAAGGDEGLPPTSVLAPADPVAGEGLPPTLVLAPADPSAGSAGVPAVEAGATLVFVATIRNGGQIGQGHDLAVCGLPETWVRVTPAAARGDSDRVLRIEIAPPRDHRSTAGVWTFELVALSGTTGLVAARATARFEVRPFAAWSVEVVPVVRGGRLRARYRAAARNDGNAVQELRPVALVGGGRIRTRFAAGQMTLHPGEVGIDVLTVRPRLPLPVGRTIERRIGVDMLPAAPQAQPEQAAPAIAARQATYRQKPIVPLWLVGLASALAIAGYAGSTLLPQKTEVPGVVGVGDAFVAEKRLRAAGLVLSQPVGRRTDPDAEPGAIVEQSPAAGSKVDEGGSVAIVVARGKMTVPVPRLHGLTRAQAGRRLRRAGLELGDAQPADVPAGVVVRSQIPDAGLSVDRGTPVKVFLAKAPPSDKTTSGDDREREMPRER